MAQMEADFRFPLQQSYRPGYVAVSPLTMQNSKNKLSGDQGSNKQMLLNFPATRAVLWDRRPLRDSIILHPTHYRNPELVLHEKPLRLAHRFAQETSADSYLCYLLGSLETDRDGQGLCVTIDRFESNEKVANGQAYGNIVIPCLLKKNSAKPKTSSEDYGESIKSVSTRCYSKAKPELEQLIAIKAYCGYHENQQTFLFHLDFTMVTSGVRFKLTAVSPVPVVPTALSKNLTSPRSMSEVQGEPKSGYLTMDQTRKLLLVLESDPKVHSLPLVGIWISGVSEITHPFVWATSLRYVFNPHLKERVVSPPESFLVVQFSPVRSKPEFYECVTTDGSQNLSFSLSSCHEVIQLPKNTLSADGEPYEMEMVAVEAGEKLTQFEAALENNKGVFSPPKTKVPVHSLADDITPRSGPMPQMRKAANIQPSVPEVSLLLEEHDPHVAPRPVPQPIQMSHRTACPEPNHGRNKGKKSSPNKKSGYPIPNGTARSAYAPNDGFTQNPGYSNGYPQNVVSGSGYPPHLVTSSTGFPQYNVAGSGYPVNTVNSLGNNAYQGQQAISQGYRETHQNPVYLDTAAQYQGYLATQMSSHSSAVPPYPNPPQQIHYAQQNSNSPYMYPVPSVPQPAYAPHLYNNITPSNASWQPPNIGQPSAAHFHGAQTHLAASVGGSVPQSLQPAYSNQLPAFSHRYPGPSSSAAGPQTQNSQNCPPLDTSVPTLATQMKSPVLRPVLDNSEMEDSELNRVEISNSSMPQQMSVQRDVGQHEGSPQNSRQPQTASSSTDSGLHFSDNQDTDVGSNTIESVKSAAAAGGAEIQPQVLQLLQLQDAQLKMLRDQLSMLLSKQQGTLNNTNQVSNNSEHPSMSGEETASQSSTATLQASHSTATENKLYHDMATQMSNQATPVKQAPATARTSSTAVNTSLFSNTSIEHVRSNAPYGEESGALGLDLTNIDMSMQTGQVTTSSPAALPQRRTSFQDTVRSSLERMRLSQEMHVRSSQDLMTSPQPSNTVASPPQRLSQDGALTSVSGETAMSFGDLQQQLGIQDRTQSMMSDMMVDMPAYTSLSPDKRSGSNFTDTDESNRSPLLGESVSMYERQLAEVSREGREQDGAPVNTLLFRDQRQFYQNLMGNVQKLLGNTGSSEDTLLGQTPQRDHAAFMTPQSSSRTYRENEIQPEDGIGHASGLHRSVSLPEEMVTHMTSQQQRNTAEPLRQSYPQTDDLSDFRETDDVAEKTRQQLQAMGINLEKMSAEEKSRMLENSSFFLDPTMLPKVQYVSLVLDKNENDLSAEADALAMKYLSDEQLSQLAKMRVGAGNSGKMGRSGLDRILASPNGVGGGGGRSNNSTMYGANHMSFASRKYLERYGLLDGGSTGGSQVKQDVATPVSSQANRDQWLTKQEGSNSWNTTQGMNVKDFLESLRERSLTEQKLAHSRENSYHSVKDESTKIQTEQNQNQTLDQRNRQMQNVQNTPVSNQMERQSNEFDRTQQRRALTVEQQHTDRPIFNTSAPAPTHLNERQINVFDNVPQSVPRTRNTGVVEANRGTRNSERGAGGSQVENVLDIPRLKELPKLL